MPRKWLPNEAGVFGAQILTESAELLSSGGMLGKKERVSLQSVSKYLLLSGHQESGEVKTNCLPSPPPRPSSYNLKGGDQGTESAELRSGVVPARFGMGMVPFILGCLSLQVVPDS